MHKGLPLLNTSPKTNSQGWGNKGTLAFPAALHGDLLAVSSEAGQACWRSPGLAVGGREEGCLQEKGAPTKEPYGHTLSLPHSQILGLSIGSLPPTMKS